MALQDFPFLNFTEVPTTEADDINRDITRWLDGKCISLDEGTHLTLYIFHHNVDSTEYANPDDTDSEPQTVTRTYAMAVRVAKPISRDAAINAAEMAAYSLSDAMAVASFNASLARKSRLNPDDTEVITHDNFINAVKTELSNIGIA
jgi:hypothetical protein